MGMPKYLIQGSYTAEGTKGLANEGGSRRRDAIARLAESLGGRLEAYYFAFGKTDVFAIMDLPDNVAAAGAAAPTTVVLITPEEMDQAAKKRGEYTPPRG
jgi:uncharacterized protein with GYD domain